MGTRVMLSTPAAITTSIVPLITAWAAKCRACCEEPHWRSTLVPGTLSGRGEASTALRATLIACSPTWPTQPMTTSSTRAGSAPVRSIRSFSTTAPRSTGCQSFSLPPLRPPAVRGLELQRLGGPGERELAQRARREAVLDPGPRAEPPPQDAVRVDHVGPHQGLGRHELDGERDIEHRAVLNAVRCVLPPGHHLAGGQVMDLRAGVPGGVEGELFGGFLEHDPL